MKNPAVWASFSHNVGPIPLKTMCDNLTKYLLTDCSFKSWESSMEVTHFSSTKRSNWEVTGCPNFKNNKTKYYLVYIVIIHTYNTLKMELTSIEGSHFTINIFFTFSHIFLEIIVSWWKQKTVWKFSEFICIYNFWWQLHVKCKSNSSSRMQMKVFDRKIILESISKNIR